MNNMTQQQVNRQLTSFMNFINSKGNKYQAFKYDEFDVETGNIIRTGYEVCYKTTNFDATKRGCIVEHATHDDCESFTLSAVFCRAEYQFEDNKVRYIDWRECEDGNVELNIEYKHYDSAPLIKRKFILVQSFELQDIVDNIINEGFNNVNIDRNVKKLDLGSLKTWFERVNEKKELKRIKNLLSTIIVQTTDNKLSIIDKGLIINICVSKTEQTAYIKFANDSAERIDAENTISFSN